MMLRRILCFAYLASLAAPASVAWGSSGDAALRLSGILISDSGQSALINHRIVRTGERVGNAEVVEISENAVVVRAGGATHVLRVGAEIDTSRPAPVVSAAPGLQPLPQAAAKPVGHTDKTQHRVVRGETLSSIAAAIARDDVSLQQAMLALYEANPAAFGGNMNVIYAGAILQVPAASILRQTSPAAAVAAVARHLEGRSPAPDRLHHPGSETIYGPVARGETLSAIAARKRPDGVSLNQMMVALYEANPLAFGDNINVLLQGSTLRIPHLDRSAYAPTEAATRRVSQQNMEWRRLRTNAARKLSAATPAVAAAHTRSMRGGS